MSITSIIPENSMHVGFFIDSYYPVVDGVIKIVDAYASRLVNKCDITVFAPRIRNAGPDYDLRFPYRVVRCLSMMREKDDYPFGLPGIDSAFRAEVRSSKLDIIHIHSPFALGLSAKTFARKCSVPMLGTIHTDFRPDVLERLGSTAGELGVKYLMRSYNACDECWTVNDVVGKTFREEYGLSRPYRVMPYATDHTPLADTVSARRDVNSLYGLEDNCFVMTYVGRLALQKKEDFILRSLSFLKQRNIEFKLLMVGDGRKQEYLKDLAEKLGLQDDVIFCGRIADSGLIKKIHARSDLLLFPSVSDTYGLVKIEAACQRTPTLFIEGSMAADGVENDVNGFTAADDEEAFAACLEELSRDRERLNRVGEGAFRDLYRSWDDLVCDVYDNYLRIIDNHRYLKYNNVASVSADTDSGPVGDRF